jgi:hypothetical protein
MKRELARSVLSKWANNGKNVFTLKDMAKLFPQDSPKTLQESINRLVKSAILHRASRGIYVLNVNANTLEEVAVALRRGEYNYLSLESALSEYGAISQVPIDRITVMTTGREGTYHTPWGTIEFTHTKRSVDSILKNIKNVGRPLRVATLSAAWRDLKRVGRNTHLVAQKDLE